MAVDVEEWIRSRLGKPATPALTEIIERLWSVGFGWFEVSNYRLEFTRYLDNDRWEEITIWVGTTKTGVVGFKGSHRAIRTIHDRSRTVSQTLAWAVRTASEE